MRIIAVPLVKPLLLATTTCTWEGGEKLPATGGCIVVFNHVSHVDPLIAAHFVYDHGRLPRYLAKSGLFKNRVLGYFLTAAGQIPAERPTKSAVGAGTTPRWPRCAAASAWWCTRRAR